MKAIKIFLITALVAASTLVATPPALAIGASITISRTTFSPGIASNVGITLTGFDATQSYQATVKFVNVSTNVDILNGTLAATSSGTTLISGYTSYSATKLGFKGTYAQVEAALSSVTWNPATVNGDSSIRIGIASVPDTNEFYDANSGHYYKYVPTGADWNSARATAEASTLFGLQGYLAEINTDSENIFIGGETSAENIWVGATEDSATATNYTGGDYDGTPGKRWIWEGAVATPLPTGSGDVAQGPSATFSSWSGGEPNNDTQPGQDCAVTNWYSVGFWNDLPCGDAYAYLIEYGGRPGETSLAITATLTTTVTSVPRVISVAAIGGLTGPVTGLTPDTTITAANGYTGTVTWSGSPTTFAASTAYTATITLTAVSGYTLTGVSANFFTVAGATSVTHSSDSGVVTAVFEATNSNTFTPFNSSTGSGDVACGSLGYFTVTANVVDGEWNCVGSVVIPDGVTSIDSAVFDAHNDSFGSNTVRTAVTSLSLPSTLISIGATAFRDATQLASLSLPANLTTIGYAAFVNAPRLTELNIPNSVTSIGDWAFAEPSGIKTLTIGSGLTSINAATFYGLSSLETLTIGSNVTTIGEKSFQNASALRSFVIPSSVTTIGTEAFAGSGLRTLTIPNSVTSIGMAAFEYNYSLATITIGAGLTDIPPYAFQYAYALTSLTLGSNVVTIGNNAFNDANSLTSLTIPNQVTSIGDVAFAGTSSLTTLKIPISITLVGASVFNGTSALVDLRYCGSLDLTGTGIDSATHPYGPATCAGITPPGVPTSVTATLTGTNSADISFTAPASNGGDTITSYIATSSPGGLTRSISQSGSGTIAFTGLSPGISYTFTVAALNAAGNSIASDSSAAITTPNVPDAPGSVTATLTSSTTANVSFTAPASNGGDTITRYVATSSPGSLTGSISQAGSGTIAITGLSLGTEYTFTVVARNSLGNSAASAPSNTITTPNPPSAPDSPTSVTATLTSATTADVSFIAPAFNGGETITSYIVTSSPGSLTGSIAQAGSGTVAITGLTAGTTYSFTVVARNSLGDSDPSNPSNSLLGTPFDGNDGQVACGTSGYFTIVSRITTSHTDCRGSVTIPSAVIAIGDRSFESASWVTSINLGNNITTIGECAFCELTRITSLVIPNSVTAIGDFAFESAHSLVSLTIGNSVETIGRYAFYGARNLVSLTLGNSVRLIDFRAFYRTFELTSIVFPNSVESIGDGAFSYSESLVSITFGSGLKTIGARAFEADGDSSLISLVIPEGVTSIGSRAFLGAEVLTRLRIASTVTTLGDNAFSNAVSLTSFEYCGTVLTQTDFDAAGLLEKEILSCASDPVSTPVQASRYNPPQTSSISAITQGCPINASTIVIKGVFLESISNISINDRLIDSSQWQQSASQIQIKIAGNSSGLMKIQIYNGQTPLLPVQSISVLANCPAPIPTDSAPPIPFEPLAPSPTPTVPVVPVVIDNPSSEMKFLGSVYFATGSSKLTEATKKTLRAIAEKIKTSSTPQVLSLGNADSRGNISYNRALSKARATAVIAFLKGITSEPEYILRWFGTSRPVATGKSASDLAKNRRVEIWRR